MADDRNLALDQRIDQRRLAGIRRTDQRNEAAARFRNRLIVRDSDIRPHTLSRISIASAAACSAARFERPLPSADSRCGN